METLLLLITGGYNNQEMQISVTLSLCTRTHLLDKLTESGELDIREQAPAILIHISKVLEALFTDTPSNNRL
jgi:hypothetical protein